jgi:hypothetical protein
MLEEKDRRVLAEIEQHLCAGDPAFARRMRCGAPACGFPALSVLCVAAFLTLPFLALFLGPRAVLLAINFTAAAVMITLLVRGRAS